MKPMVEIAGARVFLGDCRDVLKTLPDNSVDSVVTDPPYELGFMGKKWDSSGIAYDVTVWEECLRVLKPGVMCWRLGGRVLGIVWRWLLRMLGLSCVIRLRGFTAAVSLSRWMCQRRLIRRLGLSVK